MPLPSFGESPQGGDALTLPSRWLGMLSAMRSLDKYLLAAYKTTFQIGIGIHFGDVVFGRIGDKDSKQLTAIGDAVNLASRVESANKEAGTQLLITEPTFEAIRNEAIIGKSVTVSVKGKTGEYRLYEITDLASG